MKHKHTILIISCMTAVLLGMGFLYSSSPISRKVTPSSFTRSFTKHIPIELISSQPLDYNTYYIAGIEGQSVYLGNYSKPFTITELDTLLQSKRKNIIKLHGIDSIQSLAKFKLSVLSSNFYLSNGIMPVILKGKLGSWIATPFIPYKGYYFENAIALSSTKFAIRSYSLLKETMHLAILDVIDTPHVKFNFNALEQQGNGLFSTEGAMHYDKSTGKLIFIYSYRNIYFIADSTLNEIKTNNTIDTFNIAPIRVSEIDKTGTYMLSSPPLVINGKSSVSGNFLYVNSNLMGQNEDRKKFLSSSTIDVYDVAKGTYLKSFYIPSYQGKELIDYQVIANRLYIIYDDHISLYRLNI